MQTKLNTSQNISPLISFIITTYNLPTKLLKECMKSILTLSLADNEREIIIIDDGSEISQINELTACCKHITYIWQPNQGVSVARNMGLRNANGKYIQFIDGDDYLIPIQYEHCLDIVRYHNPDIVTFGAGDKDDELALFSFSEPESGSSYMHSNNLKAAVWGYIFRKDLVTNLMFTPGRVYGEDEEFTPQLFLRAERLISTNTNAYFYRQREDSIINEVNKKKYIQRLTDIENVIFHLQDIAEKIPHNDSIALQRRIAQLSMDYLYNTIRLTRSKKHLNKAIKSLRSRNLFPLPDKNYTKKYYLFRKAINSKVGRNLMFITLTRL